MYLKIHLWSVVNFEYVHLWKVFLLRRSLVYDDAYALQKASAEAYKQTGVLFFEVQICI